MLNPAPRDYRNSFVLFSEHYKQVPIYSGDHPNSSNCMRSFVINTACPDGYTPSITGSLTGGGVDNGRTFKNIQGFGLKHLNVMSAVGLSKVDYCGYTFYGRNQNNANRAWLSYTIFCHSKGAAGIPG